MERFRLLDVPVATQAHGGGHCDGAVDVGCAFTRHVAVCPSGIEQLVFPNTVGMPLRRTLFRARVCKPDASTLWT
jgi:hypothetical protein